MTAGGGNRGNRDDAASCDKDIEERLKQTGLK